MQANITTIDALRHGETVGPACLSGASDTAISTIGMQQMATALSAQSGYAAIISSPLSRCSQFAREYARQHQLALDIRPELSEINFGAWEMCTVADISKHDPESLQRFYQEPNFSPPGNGESQQQFMKRVSSAIEEIEQQYAGQQILLVTHAGVIRMLFAYALQIPLAQTFNITVNHACLSRFTRYQSGEGSTIQLCMHINSKL